MNIEIKDQQRKYSVNNKFIKSNVKAVLSLCGLKNIELSILIVNNRRMRILNKQYRGRNSSTDVLSFPMNEAPPPLSPLPRGEGRYEGMPIIPPPLTGGGKGEGETPLQPALLGDIVISMEKVHRQAKEQGHSPSHELLLLLIHGILHLTGYDHEVSPSEERRMRKKENFILSKLSGGKIASGKIQMAEVRS